jgi:hypothetical protein
LGDGARVVGAQGEVEVALAHGATGTNSSVAQLLVDQHALAVFPRQAGGLTRRAGQHQQHDRRRDKQPALHHLPSLLFSSRSQVLRKREHGNADRTRW